MEEESYTVSKDPSCLEWIKDTPQGSVLSNAEALKLLNALRIGGTSGFTRTQAETIWNWAEKTRVQFVFLDLVLDGSLEVVGFKNAEPVFQAVREPKGSSLEDEG